MKLHKAEQYSRINISLFFSQSDHHVLKKILSHISILKNSRDVELVTRNDILPGENVDIQTKKILENSDIILLILSSSFLNSEFLPTSVLYKETIRILKTRNTLIIPIIAKVCAWNLIPRIKQLSPLPAAHLAIKSKKWDNYDEPYLIITKKLKLLIDKLRRAKFEKYRSDFLANVSSTLEISGHSTSKVNHSTLKNFDEILIQSKSLGKPRKTLGVCVTQEQEISLEVITKIFETYKNVYETRKVDEIFIITDNIASLDANQFLDRYRFIYQMTLNDLQNQIMNFSPYLDGLITNYLDSPDGISSYYIPLNFHIDKSQTHSGGLEEFIFRWLDTQNDIRPLAILGSYGLGKSTFARYLSYKIAYYYKENQINRIPILIRLSDISSEQSLEGLLGKHFTSNALIPNYTFESFMALNEHGRFIILLDGFDEMKQTLSWDEFKYNFKQINRLVIGESKIIILGRPTAFMNDREHLYALHGRRFDMWNNEVKEENYPDYKEIYLTPFDVDQIEDFFTKFFTYKKSHSATSDKNKYLNLMNKSIHQIAKGNIVDIAQRPVQLKMLAEILPQWGGNLRDMTTGLLYSEFIDLIIEREQEKHVRLKFRKKERRKFAQEIACWLWKERKEMSITAENIPDQILRNYRKANENLEAIRRDLVSACFLERKLGSSLYFPHRSFQEFLVAEGIVEGLSSGKMNISEADKLITPEIADFLSEIVGYKTFREWDVKLKNHQGLLSLSFLSVWYSNEKFLTFPAEQINNSYCPWYVIIVALAVSQKRNATISKREAISLIFRKMYSISDHIEKTQIKSIEESQNDQIRLLLVCFLSLLIINSSKEFDSEVLNALSILSDCRYLYISDNQEEKGDYKYVLPSTLSKIFLKLNISVNKYSIDIRGVYSVILDSIKRYCFIKEWITNFKYINYKSLNLPEKVNLEFDEKWILRDLQDLKNFHLSIKT